MNREYIAHPVDLLESYYLYLLEPEFDTRATPEDRIADAYQKYHASVNMSRTELEKWSENECSKHASLDRSPIRRNLELLDTLKKDWTLKHASWALKTVGFIARAKKMQQSTTQVKGESGRMCGTKRDIALKNWGYNPDKSGDALDYKTELLRAEKTTPADAVIESKDGKRFQQVIQNAITRQVEAFIGALPAIELKPITSYGLTVSVLKQQLAKMARIGTVEDRRILANKREDMPSEVTGLLDAKAQMLLKGYDSLTDKQKELILEWFGKDWVGYKGIDFETSAQILSIVKKALTDAVSAQDALRNALPTLALNRAKAIADTETAQAVELSRYLLYKDAGYEEQKWVTAKDSKVRTAHRSWEADGWVPLGHTYSHAGHKARRPSDEIRCRCSMLFRKRRDGV